MWMDKSMTYCKECNGEIIDCDLANKYCNEFIVVKKKWVICKRCMKIKEELA